PAETRDRISTARNGRSSAAQSRTASWLHGTAIHCGRRSTRSCRGRPFERRPTTGSPALGSPSIGCTLDDVIRVWTGIAPAAAAVSLSGCGGNASAAKSGSSSSRCSAAARASWQRLANQIHAPVYCPGWLPDPLTGVIGSRDNNIHSVSPDRSFLESWIWQEPDRGAAGGELRVNLG